MKNQSRRLKRMEKIKISTLSPNTARKRATAERIPLAQRARVVLADARSEIVKAGQNAVRVLRIMVFLHSAKDLSCVLRLYGIEQES
jgi:hypothetical protein